MDEKLANPENADALDARIRAVCATLESVARQFPPESAEYRAIADAALAYAHVHQQEGLRRSYEALRAVLAGNVTDAMVEEVDERLRRLGIDPEELES